MACRVVDTGERRDPQLSAAWFVPSRESPARFGEDHLVSHWFQSPCSNERRINNATQLKNSHTYFFTLLVYSAASYFLHSRASSVVSLFFSRISAFFLRRRHLPLDQIPHPHWPTNPQLQGTDDSQDCPHALKPCRREGCAMSQKPKSFNSSNFPLDFGGKTPSPPFFESRSRIELQLSIGKSP